MVTQGLFQSQKMSLEQVLAPQQLLSLEILLAPLLELNEKIDQELAENPILEQSKSGIEELIGDPLSKQIDKDSSAEDLKSDENSEIAELASLADSWQDSLPLRSRNTDEEEIHEYMFNSLVAEPSLQDQLLEQLRMSNCNEATAKIAENIIGNINDQGYLCIHLADIATTFQTKMTKVENALKLVQSFDPPGIGARDIKESLLLQLKRKDDDTKKIVSLIENHLEDISRNKIPQIAKKMRISKEEVYELLEELKKLNPYPASIITPSQPHYVMPEFEIVKKDNEYIVLAERSYQPKLKISRRYLNMLESPNVSEETKKYIREKLTNGKMLIKSLEQRQSTIHRIANRLIIHQKEFLDNGIDKLRPLKMQTIADELELHETTISRAIANKYVKTPQGVFPFKYFFTGGYQTEKGEDVSSRGVKEQIRDLIAEENKKKPLSDNKIMTLLKEKGITVARRTIAKYRDELSIPSSSLRKEF